MSAPVGDAATTGSVAVARSSRVMSPRLWLPLFLGLLLLAVIAGLAIGAKTLSPGEVLASLLGNGVRATDIVVLEQRVPRTVIGVVAGAALAAAGSLMQALTRNPLADPGILGVNAGAAFAVVASATLLGTTDLSAYMWAAYAGAGCAALAVYALGGAGSGSATPVRLTLAGVAITAALTAVTQVLVLADAAVFEEFRGWINGSLQNRWFEHLLPVTPFLAVGALLAVMAAPGLDALALGTQVGRALGVPVEMVRAMTMGAVTLLAGGATAMVGPLVFVGLAAPFVARRIVGADLRVSLPAAALLGAVLVVSADVIARIAVAAEAPVGAVVTVAGAPLFIALVRAKGMPRL